MKNEIEATFLSINKDATRDKLKKAGFELKTPEYLMCRKTFDFSRVVPGCNKWGRVRQESDKVTMTVKEIRGSDINDTYEVELVVNDFDIACSFFETCDIHAKAFQEIEGIDEKTVRKVSSELGFNFEKAIFGSIDLVYEKEIGISAETIIRLPEITFANPPKKNAA